MCFNNGVLFSATASVTANTDNGTEQSGTLSLAISTVPTAISIESSATPMTLTGNMPSITSTVTFQSDAASSSRTINAGTFTSLSITGATSTVPVEVTLNSDVILNNSSTNITIPQHSALIINGSNNSSIIQMSCGNLYDYGAVSLTDYAVIACSTLYIENGAIVTGCG